MAKAQKEMFIRRIIIGDLPEFLQKRFEVILAEKRYSIPACGGSIFEGKRKQESYESLDHVLWGGWSMEK